jgi:DNA-binding MarR family transcriptional regulator
MGSEVFPTRPASAAERQVIDAVRRLVRSLREGSRAVERDAGLTGAQLAVLHALDRERGASLNDLAARTMTHQSSVSVVVSGLVERGLVRRGRADGDGRRLALTLTAKGSAAAGRAPLGEQEQLLAALRQLPGAQVQTLARGLAAWTSILAAEDEPAEPAPKEAARRSRPPAAKSRPRASSSPRG